ncbi:hypothetical protein F5878DRAFT_232874 [Lentinula raphanica]|uniref:Uncharacterized protein n=1 Tax=Lentinula raphanica TaxID=153919 RepID=A0AA38P688_9AGAR|nr:hypothetical protein F5878DRAFT_232874 [Lentinula raphanica]
MSWPTHSGFNPMYTPYHMMNVPTSAQLGIPFETPTTMALGNTLSQSTHTSIPIPRGTGTWTPNSKGRFGVEHRHHDGSPCTSHCEHEASAIIDQDPHYLRAIGIMKALAVHEYLAARRTGNLDPFGVSKEPEIQGSLYATPSHYIDESMEDRFADRYASSLRRRGIPPGNWRGNGRSHPYTPRTVVRAPPPTKTLEEKVNTAVTKSLTKATRTTARYIPHLGSPDLDPFENGEQRFVAIQNLHYRPGHGPAPGFVWDVDTDGKLQEDRDKLGPRSYDMTEKVEPMPTPGPFTRKARSYPVDEPSARGMIRITESKADS